MSPKGTALSDDTRQSFTPWTARTDASYCEAGMTGIKRTQWKQTMILINTKQANMTLMRKAAVNVSVGRQQTTLHWSSQDTANEVLEVLKTYSFFAHRL